MSTHTDRYPPGEQVRVFLPGDSCDDQTGTVAWSYADCDEMVHVIVFGDGSRGHYCAAELFAVNGGHPRRYPPRPSRPARQLVRSGPEPVVDLAPAAAETGYLADPHDPEEN